MPRRTKIIATIGPASDNAATLRSMIDAGMDIARMGLAHETLELALERYHRIRAAAAEAGKPIGILVDLPGPKVRAGRMPSDGMHLADLDVISLVPGQGDSTSDVVQVDYDDLLVDVHDGDYLTFGDGAVQVRCIGRKGDRLDVQVIHGGLLKGRPGIHIQSDRLRMPTPTPEDLRLADAFVEAGVDMLALSFVRSAHDVRRIGTEPYPRGPLVVAKIETRAAVENLESIIAASGAVMVARGDLGSEFPIEELPHLQKEIIRRCIAVGRPVITATQMLESMVHAPSPTRAEASDVANAVFDGSSSVMLSGETAIGVDPTHVVGVMARIAERADEEFDYPGWSQGLAELHLDPTDVVEDAITNAMTSAAHRAATEIGAKAIICLSRSGFTVRSIARFRPQARILGFTTDERTLRQLSISWGTTPYLIEGGVITEELVPQAIERAVAEGEVAPGDVVVVLAGSGIYKGRVTDTVRIVRIP
ncbi:MAG: pyruvate kinase [Acidimicrobiales bacterium]|jgi:pyruvate kinase|nr:pyruvate kinase [Acidimicrobiales bacterium]